MLRVHDVHDNNLSMIAMVSMVSIMSMMSMVSTMSMMSMMSMMCAVSLSLPRSQHYQPLQKFARIFRITVLLLLLRATAGQHA